MRKPSPPLARLREPPPSLSLIPGGLGVFLKPPELDVAEPDGTVEPGLPLVIGSPGLQIYKLYIYIYIWSPVLLINREISSPTVPSGSTTLGSGGYRNTPKLSGIRF
jgi:hypothetical protein